MGGVLTHVTAGLICLFVVHMIHFKWEYSLAIFVGNILPDGIRLGFSGIKQGTLALFTLENDAFYEFLAKLTASYANWFTFGFFVLGTTLMLYHFHYIKKKKMEEYDELYLFLLIGIILHLIIDAFYAEPSPWL